MDTALNLLNALKELNEALPESVRLTSIEVADRVRQLWNHFPLVLHAYSVGLYEVYEHGELVDLAPLTDDRPGEGPIPTVHSFDFRYDEDALDALLTLMGDYPETSSSHPGRGDWRVRRTEHSAAHGPRETEETLHFVSPIPDELAVFLHTLADNWKGR